MQKNSNECNSSIAVINALNKAMEALKDYPSACNAFIATENKVLTEEKWMPDMLRSLLLTLKSQKAMLETLKMDENTEKAFEEIEKTALHAVSTIIRIAKVDPEELKLFLQAKNIFFDSYNELLETPLDNIIALHSFINAEIAVLENQALKGRAILQAHLAIIKVIKEAIHTLEAYPEALQAFLTAEKIFIETREKASPGISKEDDLTWPLLDSHILLFKAQRAMLHVLDYNAPYEAYNEFAKSAIRALNARQDIYKKLKDSPEKQLLQQSLLAFQEQYHQFLASPRQYSQPFKNFLDMEIEKLDTNCTQEAAPEPIMEMAD